MTTESREPAESGDVLRPDMREVEEEEKVEAETSESLRAHDVPVVGDMRERLDSDNTSH